MSTHVHERPLWSELGFSDQGHLDAYTEAGNKHCAGVKMERELRRDRIRDSLIRYDLSHVRARAVKDGHYAKNDILRIESLYKDFMLECMVEKDSREVAPEIDEFWHTHLLFTKDYAKMCMDIGGFFVHHNPADDAHPDHPCMRDKCGEEGKCKGCKGER